jgi:hypothetical protein
VDAGDARPMPRMQNTDGEDRILTVDRFDVADGKGTRWSPTCGAFPTRAATRNGRRVVP